MTKAKLGKSAVKSAKKMAPKKNKLAATFAAAAKSKSKAKAKPPQKPSKKMQKVAKKANKKIKKVLKQAAKKAKKASKKDEKRARKPDTSLSAYILLDRSGSMTARWQEALSSINAYVGKLSGNAKVTVATFDFQEKLHFDIIRDHVSLKRWKKLSDKDATPRGFTPLLDAVGRIVPLAEKHNNASTVIVVMTDGYENASKEIKTRAEVETMLDRCKKRGWEIIFLGADFDATNDATSLGIARGKMLNMTKSNMTQTLANLGMKTMAYAQAMNETVASGKNFVASSSPISFSAQDRAQAVSKPPKKQ